jgi:hypothetical protein
MDAGSIIIFVGFIVGSCIIGGAVYSGLAKIADAIGVSTKRE